MASLEIDIDGTRRTVELDTRYRLYTVGRRHDAEILIVQRDVARLHARIAFRRDRWYLDLVGHAVTLNTRALRDGALALEDGDRIAIGDHAIVYRAEPAALEAIMAELRTLLHVEPSAFGFDEIVAQLERWPHERPREMALSYVRHHLDSWPDRHCRLPSFWYERHTVLPVHLALVRAMTLHLSLDHDRSGWLDVLEGLRHMRLRGEPAAVAGRSDMVAALSRVLAHPRSQQLRSLDLSGVPLGVAGCALLARHARLPQLRALDLTRCAIGDDALETLEGLEALAQLRQLELDHNPFADHARARALVMRLRLR